jgi:cation transport ATPase
VSPVERDERELDDQREMVGRRALFIARQSVLAGIALSLLAMAVAAAGYLPPVHGALLQEVIDVGVIANALRALRD